MKVVFLKAEEELIDFLNRCKLKDFEAILCPCYNGVFDKEVTTELENTNPDQLKKVGRQDQRK